MLNPNKGCQQTLFKIWIVLASIFSAYIRSCLLTVNAFYAWMPFLHPQFD